MASHAPAACVAGGLHLAHAQPHVVDAGHVPAQVMQARPLGAGCGNQMVIAAVDRVNERNVFAGPVTHAQAKHVLVEPHAALDILRVQEHMRQPARAHLRHLRAPRRPAAADGVGWFRFTCTSGIGHLAFGDTDLHRKAVGVAQPEPVRRPRRVRRAQGRAESPCPQPQRFEVVGEAAEAQVQQPLGPRRLVHDAPAEPIAERVQRKPVSVAPRVESEGAVEALGLGEVGHAEAERVHRMHAERIAAPGPARAS